MEKKNTYKEKEKKKIHVSAFCLSVLPTHANLWQGGMKSTTDYATWGVSPQELVLSIQFTHNLVQDNSSFDKVREAETCNTNTKCFILIQLQHISFRFNQSIQ